MSLVKIALFYLFEIIELLIFIRCIISWFPLGNNKFIEFIYSVTEPILAPVRNLLGKYMTGSMYVDFSPIVVYLILIVIRRLIF